MDPFEKLGQALVALLSYLRNPGNHALFQGTYLGALVEAQGGQLGPDLGNHLVNLRGTAAGIRNRQEALNIALNRIAAIDAGLAHRLRTICAPTLRLSDEYLRTAAETERVAIELSRTHPARLRGVMLGLGGQGPEIGRTSRALADNQINHISTQLAARGIESRLIPSARQSLQSVMFSIRQLPLNADGTAAKVTAAMAAMRAAFREAIQQAALRGQVLLRAALVAIEKFLTGIGSRIFVPFIVIPPGLLDQMERDAGFGDPADLRT